MAQGYDYSRSRKGSLESSDFLNVGLDGEDASSVDIEELAAAVRGRSPLLLEIVEHSEKVS